MYGMSAKDRMAMFEKNGTNDSKKTSTPAKKKIGKLNVAGANAENNTSAKKKVLTKKKPKAVKTDNDKPKEEVKEHVQENHELHTKTETTEIKPESTQEKKTAQEATTKSLLQEEEPQIVTDKPSTAEAKETKKEESKPIQKEIKEENKAKQEETPSEKKPGKQVAEQKAQNVADAKPAQKEIKEESQVRQEEKPLEKEPVKHIPEEKPKDVVDAKLVKMEESKPKAAKAKEDILTPKKRELVEQPPKLVKKDDSSKPEEKAPQVEKKTETKEESKQKEEVVPKAEEQKDESASTEGEPEKPKVRPLKKRMPLFKAVPEEFYDTLFYFSGMGTVVGSALNEGVYVPNRATKTALDSEVIEGIEAEKDKEREHDTYLIRTARKQAYDLAEELRKLQSLLMGLPNFGDKDGDLHKIERKPFDSVMHAKYFQNASADPAPKRQVPVKPAEQQWPPTVVAPIKIEIQPQLQTKPVSQVDKDTGVFKGKTDNVSPGSRKLTPLKNQLESGGARPYGVHTAKPQPSSLPWQEKYGSKTVADTKAPEPFHAQGELPSGLKPWELSRLRGLEAKGYVFNHEEPKSGADYSDSFYHGSAPVEMELTTEITSLAPFLVSNKTKQVDRQVLSGAQDPIAAGTYTLTKKELHGSQTDSLPYSDV